MKLGWYSLAVAFSLSAGAVCAQQGTDDMYRDALSAREMIGAEVRGAAGSDGIGEVKDIFVGADGRIDAVIVEVGGFLEMGDQHIAVKWRDIEVGPDMQWVRTPLRKVDGGYALHGRVPQGEEQFPAPGAWRVNELIGDYATLDGERRHGMVVDVTFGRDGKARHVVVNRIPGPGTRGGWYGYPYADYNPGNFDYRLPPDGAHARYRFDYRKLGELSRFSDMQR